MSDTTEVRSPCVGVCMLDDKDVCVACRRTGMEIAEWCVMSDKEKRAVLERLKQLDPPPSVEAS